MREVQNDSENEKSYAHGNPLPKPVRMALHVDKHMPVVNTDDRTQHSRQ